jgi:cathepsin A (carboxypeptidase C)
MLSKAFSLAGFASIALADIKDELVTSLPGIGDIPFNMYSGYAEVTATKGLHYVLVESKRAPTTDPLMVWFNGGPGCSSMMGLFQEHGPYVVNDGTDYLVENIWSWNNQANVLYIEMPGGVGWSTCDSTKGECTFDDQKTADDNMVALQNWFKKFTAFQKNPLYISGESYGGVYVPYVAKEIYDYNSKAASGDFKFNIQGFIVGNGVTNWTYDTTPAFVKMGFWHGLYDYDTYLAMEANKCDFSNLQYGNTLSEECATLFDRFNTLTESINGYDVYRKCWSS